MKTLGSRIRQLRKNRNLSQKELGDIVGAHYTTISLYENDIRQPPLEMLIRLSKLYGVSMNFLFGEDDRNLFDISKYKLTEIDIVNLLYLIQLLDALNREIEKFEEMEKKDTKKYEGK